MNRLIAWVRRFVRELRRRRVIRVAVVYATTAFVILQLAEILVEPFGLGNWAIRLVTFLLVLGFPLAIGLAWVYNLTEEGVVRVGEAVASEAAADGSPLTSNGLIVGLLVLAIGLLLYPRVFSSGERPSGRTSSAGPDTTRSDTAQLGSRTIAVLPFENQGGEKSQQFTEGVHDGLLTKLARVSDLTVISRTSVARYAQTDKTIPQIARELGAGWVVEGAVQRAGGQVQVNAQLIRAPTDAHQWAKSYRREITPENFFAIQSELTKEIAQSLKARLSPEEGGRVDEVPTQNIRAYQFYVQGRRELARGREGTPGNAVRLFRRALGRDSTFALAWSGLADAAASGYDGYDTLSVRPGEAARRALRLAPDLAEARASMGLVHLRERRGPAALRELRRAVRLKPSYAQAQDWLGQAQMVLGRLEEGLRHLKLAADLDPKNLGARHVLYDAYVAVGEYEKALAEVRAQTRRYPEFPSAYFAKTRALYHLGRYEQARKAVRNGMSLSPGRYSPIWQVYLAAVETAAGDTTRARKRVDRVMEKDHPGWLRAYAHAAFGNAEAAFEALKATEEWDYVPTMTVRYLTFPEGMRELRDHPRYEALIREVNQAWGLNPDGSIPNSADVSLSPSPEENA